MNIQKWPTDEHFIERKMARFHETTLVIVGEGSGNASLESSNWSLGGEEEGALLINPSVLLSF